MNNRTLITITTVIFLSTSLFFPYMLTTTGQDGSEQKTVLNVYYIEKRDNRTFWLVPYEPDAGAGKKYSLKPGQYFNISQGIIDRKYNPDLKPQVELYIDTHGVEDLAINVLVEFRYFSGQYLPHNPNVTAYFDPFETRGSDDGPELVKISSSYYSEVPRDIPQTDYGAIMRFSLSFESADVNDTVEIMCGEDGYHSLVRTPYDRSYSSTLVDNDSEEGIEVNTTLCWTVGILFLVVCVVIIIIMHFKEK